MPVVLSLAGGDDVQMDDLRNLTISGLTRDIERQLRLGRRHHYIAEMMFWGAVLSSATATVCAVAGLPTWGMAIVAILPAAFTAGGRNGFHRTRADWHYRYWSTLKGVLRLAEEAQTDEELKLVRRRQTGVENEYEREYPAANDPATLKELPSSTVPTKP
jgi:hypothetical protein